MGETGAAGKFSRVIFPHVTITKFFNIPQSEVSMIGNLRASMKAIKHFQAGIRKVAAGDFEAAIDKFSKAIQAEPDMMDAYAFRGNACLDSGDYHHAIADLDYVIQKVPDHHAAYYNRSIAKMELGDKEAALADMDQAIRLAPEETGYYLHRSIIHSFREEYSLALRDADKVIELGDAVPGYNNRAIILEKQGDSADAIEAWTKVLELNPKDGKAYCRRGILLANTGNKERAIEDLKKGLKHKEGLSDTLRAQVKDTLQGLGIASLE